MDYPGLLEGRLVRRYKRFLADIRLRNGHVVTAHCANPGSMKTCAPEGAHVWVSRALNKSRKLRYTWELVSAEGALVNVNPLRANDLIDEALRAGAIRECASFTEIRREVRCGASSRIDFKLSATLDTYIEVKSVTLNLGDGHSSFPDGVSSRGSRHLRELMALRAAGHRAVLLFCCARSDTECVHPADDIDPEYGNTLRQAAAAGVEILAYRTEASPRSVRVTVPARVDLAPYRMLSA